MNSIADIYHELIVDHARNPHNFGELKNPDITHCASNVLCGDDITIDLNINQNKITDIKFRGKGCAICMSCASVLTEFAKGNNIDDINSIEDKVLTKLGLNNLEAIRSKCARLSFMVLRFALDNNNTDKGIKS